MAPPATAPLFTDEDEEFDPAELDPEELEVEDVVEALDAFAALKNPWTAGSSNLVLLLLYRPSVFPPKVFVYKTI